MIPLTPGWWLRESISFKDSGNLLFPSIGNALVPRSQQSNSTNIYSSLEQYLLFRSPQPESILQERTYMATEREKERQSEDWCEVHPGWIVGKRLRDDRAEHYCTLLLFRRRCRPITYLLKSVYTVRHGHRFPVHLLLRQSWDPPFLMAADPKKFVDRNSGRIDNERNGSVFFHFIREEEASALRI